MRVFTVVGGHHARLIYCSLPVAGDVKTCNCAAEQMLLTYNGRKKVETFGNEIDF